MIGAVTAHGVTDYCRQLTSWVALSVLLLIRPPLHPRRTIAARRLARNSLLLLAGCSVGIIILVLAVDLPAINIMLPRGTPELWPIRIFTDFAKTKYVLLSLGISLMVIAAVAPMVKGVPRATLAALGLRIQFFFLAVAVPNLVGYLLKGIVGRGRPFAGGSADAFHYSPFVWIEAFASFPSSHAITSFALALAVATVWPRMRLAMVAYAVLIAISRVLLLAHYPSDVLAGGLIGLLGAMFVRQWFAARRLGFVISRDGRILPFPGPSFASLKKVAARAFAQ